MDFSSSTNLKVGETGTIQVIIDSRVNSTTTRIHVTLDSRNIYENKINCTGRTATTVEYTPESTGTHTLSIEFFDEKERIDRRYLKVFVG
jgi:hypothetical protein